MRSRGRETGAALLLLLVVVAVCPAFGVDYRAVSPGYDYVFPRDHFNHREFRTEWWYYTGNVLTEDGRRFGFELTFFRQALARTGDTSTWHLEDLYLAHLALSDIENGEFFYSERINRQGPGLAGASLEQRRIWNGNWQVSWEGEVQNLRAVDERFTLRLALEPEKPPVVHGEGGMSRKAPGESHASHYISFTRLAASGELVLDGRSYELEGSAWMDHEFFSNLLAADQVGWDWMAIQLENGADVMLAQLRGSDGLTSFALGTVVSPDGRSRHLGGDDFTLEPVPGKRWEEYPIEWIVRIRSLDLELRVTTPLPGQELATSTGVASYWEGAVDYTGTLAGEPVRGVGYLEMTGYEEPVVLEQDNAP